MSNNTTFSAKAAREELKNQMNDISYDLCGYDGYICDAISELADSWTSIYTSNQVTYYRTHEERARDALTEGLALSPADYFAKYPNHGIRDYEAHVGACAEYMDNERAAYEGLGTVARYVAIGALADKYGDILDTEAFEDVCPEGNDIDTCDTFEDVAEAVCKAYAEALDLFPEETEEAA